MRQAHSIARLFAPLLLAVLLAAPALAQIVEEPIGGFHGEVVGDTPGALKNVPQAPPGFIGVAYDNSASPANFGFSSTDLAADWGDRLLLVGSGMLSEHVFTIFNAGTSAGVLLTANVAVDFFDAASATFLGGYTTNVNFGAGLPVGFYATVTVPGLDPLVINISSTDIIVIQTLLGTTGAANRLGIASLDPITVGTSPISMYIAASTVNAGTPGFYNIGNPPLPANPGYRLSLVDPPVPAKTSTWGGLKKLYR
jgi:hypothetical protein